VFNALAIEDAEARVPAAPGGNSGRRQAAYANLSTVCRESTCTVLTYDRR
jgi:hypothetical protein